MSNLKNLNLSLDQGLFMDLQEIAVLEKTTFSQAMIKAIRLKHFISMLTLTEGAEVLLKTRDGEIRKLII